MQGSPVDLRALGQGGSVDEAIKTEPETEDDIKMEDVA